MSYPDEREKTDQDAYDAALKQARHANGTAGELYAENKRLRAQLTRWRTTVTEIRDRERAKLQEDSDSLWLMTRASLCDEILNLMEKELPNDRPTDV